MKKLLCSMSACDSWAAMGIAQSHMNHPTELHEKTFRHFRKVSRNFCRKLNLLFRFKLEKYLCIIVADLPLIAKI